MNLVQQNSTHLLLDSHEKLMKHPLLPLRKPYDTFQVSVFQRSIYLMEADNKVPEGLSIEQNRYGKRFGQISRCVSFEWHV